MLRTFYVQLAEGAAAYGVYQHYAPIIAKVFATGAGSEYNLAQETAARAAVEIGRMTPQKFSDLSRTLKAFIHTLNDLIGRASLSVSEISELHPTILPYYNRLASATMGLSATLRVVEAELDTGDPTQVSAVTLHTAFDAFVQHGVVSLEAYGIVCKVLGMTTAKMKKDLEPSVSRLITQVQASVKVPESMTKAMEAVRSEYESKNQEQGGSKQEPKESMKQEVGASTRPSDELKKHEAAEAKKQQRANRRSRRRAGRH